ncbi:N-acetylglucosamine kinase [Phaeacidiphilus oryzae]|uniref:N-acetylglucosamine kinase n=1 Tax=Phaeacidiphilus oryzae TaxID=348818 RepID=UPI0005605A42|nr:BadF/BadG/BcrA/BcrD ATPase family protein [Phaeacidiphilus oryzae]
MVPGVLAVDAGNSKTDVVLVGLDGRLLGTARGGGFRPGPGSEGAAAAIAGLRPAVAEAARRAGLAWGRAEVAGRPLVTHVSACLANADLPVEVERLQNALAREGWGATSVVANDTFALLRSGTDEPRGVAVVCGAGINCVGLLPDGRTARFPALGRLTGDWGGGGGLAEEVMWWSVRSEDGRGPATALAAAVGEHFGYPDAGAVAEAVHLGEVSRERLLQELAPVLFRVAEGGDPVARELVERQAEEVCAMAVVALRRLGLLAEAVDVVLGGGVLAARQRLLLAGIRERLGVAAPKARVRVVSQPPVLGAALLGLDHLAAPAEAGARLRAALATP